MFVFFQKQDPNKKSTLPTCRLISHTAAGLDFYGLSKWTDLTAVLARDGILSCCYEETTKEIKNNGYRTMQYLILPYNRKYNVYQSMFTYIRTNNAFVCTYGHFQIYLFNTNKYRYGNLKKGNLHMHDLHTNLCVQVFYNCFWYENYNLQR